MTTILKSYRIKPSKTINDIKKYELDGLDKNNYFYTTIYFGYSNKYFPSEYNSYKKILEKIKKDLSILQNIFPMFSGHIDYKYKENKAEVICDGSGIVLIESENNNLELNDLSILKDNNDITSSETIYNLFTPNIEYLKKKFNINHFPFIIQITKLKCNSIILTSINSHMIMDGYSYELFQKTWKSISGVLDKSNIIYPNENTINYNDLIEKPSIIPKGWIEINKEFLFNTSKNQNIAPSIRLHFSKNKINDLKEKLNKEIKKENKFKYVTSEEIICSILWKSIIKYRKLEKNTNTTLIRPTNIRKILKLHDNSFGNLAIMNGITLSYNEIELLDILDIIKRIQLQKELYSNEKILQNLKYFKELNSDKALVMDFISMNNNDIFINSWNKFESLSSFNIGFGDNVFVSLPPLMPGIVMILPSCLKQKEEFIAHIYLQEKLLRKLESDTDLLKYLS
jgi:hypothetical protein